MTSPAPNDKPLARFGVVRFLLVSVAVCLVMFWPAASGQKLFAPLDIAPNLFSKYKYADPTANGVPANHYIIDMIMGDLPRNWTAYQALRRGEMPWWDPYTHAGKPLAAEANAINISDPPKVLLYHLLPFELAYNWVRIVTFIVSGLGAFCLLRRFRFGFAAALWGGLLYQFAGCNAMMFSGPTVQASFSYYPWLWLLWDKGAVERRFFWFAVSTFITALIFLSGNLQSHTYVFFFALAFLMGYGWRQKARWGLLVGGTAFALGLGLCLALPFVSSQLEFFLLSLRKVEPIARPLEMLTGVLSLTSFFPWSLGTFRTLNLGKVVYPYATGFWIYIGSAALVIAVFGAAARQVAGTPASNRKRTAFALVALFFVICSTPLLKLFYNRTAWLAVLGLVVLFAFGWERLRSLSTPAKRWGWAVVGLALAVAVVVDIGGGLIYPRLQSRIEAFVLKQQSQNVGFDEATDLRRFQVANFPNEVTFKNREPLVAFLGLIALGVFLIRAPVTGRQLWLWSILVLSTLPVLWFVGRYIPQHPVALWHKLRDGGPEQQRVIEVIKAKGLRLREVVPGQHEYLFPGAFAQLYGVHVLQSHTSQWLRNAGMVKDATGEFDPAYHDVLYRCPARGMERGELEIRTNGPPARYHWAQPSNRSLEIAGETLNTITLEIGPGLAGELIRTDTYYPGWRVAPGTPAVKLIPEPPFSARITVPESARRVQLVYEPNWWRTGLGVAAVAGALLLLSLVISAKQLRKLPANGQAVSGPDT